MPWIVLIKQKNTLLCALFFLTIVFCAGSFQDPGVTATNDVDGNITSSITTSGTVNAETAGTYSISYSVSDAAGNTASVVQRTVIIADITAPVITLIGSSKINLTVGATFSDPGATASDNVDGNITSSITTSGTVNAGTAGTYTISYSVSDAAGNTASVVQRTVTIIAATTGADTTNPVITLTGSSTINLTVGETFTDPGATATDAVDGNITSSISGSVDTSTAGIARTVIISAPVARIYIPDDNFEQFLIDNGHDDVMDYYILTSSALNVTEIKCKFSWTTKCWKWNYWFNRGKWIYKFNFVK